MEEKKIKEMTNEEILCQQLELLARKSKQCADELLPHLSNAMCQIYRLINKKEADNITPEQAFILAAEEIKGLNSNSTI